MIFAGWRDNLEFQEPKVIMSHCIKKNYITESKHKLKKKRISLIVQSNHALWHLKIWNSAHKPFLNPKICQKNFFRNLNNSLSFCTANLKFVHQCYALLSPVANEYRLSKCIPRDWFHCTSIKRKLPENQEKHHLQKNSLQKNEAEHHHGFWICC